MTLFDAKVGDSVIVLTATGASSKRLKELGFIIGANITVLNKNLLGGRIILFRNAKIAVRDSTAKNILVKFSESKQGLNKSRQKL